jgi:CDP-diacylglycerol--glycerol-3-phosphate 3-phosphatidyltransferase
MKKEFRITWPTVITLVRLFVSPLLFPFLAYYVVPQQHFWANIWIAVLLGVICLTDFLDGYLARWHKQETELGKILDPIADKLLAIPLFIVLSVLGRVYFFWTILIVGREIIVTSMRHVAVTYGFSLDVRWSGKVKAFLQYLYLVVVIAQPFADQGFLLSCCFYSMLFCSLLSGVWYVSSFIDRVTIATENGERHEI